MSEDRFESMQVQIDQLRKELKDLRDAFYGNRPALPLPLQIPVNSQTCWYCGGMHGGLTCPRLSINCEVKKS